MIDIRSNRLHKKRKKTKSLVLVVKVFAISYMSFSTLYYLSGGTNASFSDTETVSTGFLANWDEEIDKPVDANSLKITAVGKQGDNLTFTFKNFNDHTIENLNYQLYFSVEDSPTKGTELLIGSIKNLKPAQEKKLVLKAAKGTGKYILKVTLSKDVIIWSEVVIIPNTEEHKQGNDSSQNKAKEDNEGAPPIDANTPKEQEVKPEPNKKEIDEEVNQQDSENKTKENNEGASPNDTNTPKEQEVKPELDKKEVNEEVNQQDSENKSEGKEDGNSN